MYFFLVHVQIFLIKKFSNKGIGNKIQSTLVFNDFSLSPSFTFFMKRETYQLQRRYIFWN